MDVLGQLSDPLVAAVAVFIVHFLSRGRFRVLEQRADGVDQRLDQIDERLDRVDQRFDQLDQRIDQLTREMNARFDTLRSDLTRIALAVGVRREPEAG